MRPIIGCSYSATSPSATLSASKSTSSPPWVSTGTSFGHAGVVERVRPRRRLVAVGEARREQRLELVAVLAAEIRDREPAVVGELGHAERAAQRDPLGLVDRRDLDPAVLGLVEPVARVDPVQALVEPRPGDRLAVDEQRVRREHRAAVDAATSTAPGPRRCGAGGTARRGSRRPRASRWRRRTSRSGSRAGRCRCAPRRPRTRARPTPGRAGRARRSARAGPRARTPTCCSRRRRG